MRHGLADPEQLDDHNEDSKEVKDRDSDVYLSPLGIRIDANNTVDDRYS